ncbi:MAG: hydantoinase B/oxoprolinase family protein [Cyanobacteria bacterium]|nr:hydantoinase B/oxoprolinase family protein [Cyanobacteriota bacterium]
MDPETIPPLQRGINFSPVSRAPGASLRLQAGWRFWVDRGGTFTDLVALPPHGPLVVRKVLSVQPQLPGDPAVAAIRDLLALEVGAAIPPGLIQELRLGTTVATNALLERSGAPPLLLVNEGFADALLIGDQHRPDLFALQPIRPAPLYRQVLEVAGRLGADGLEIEPLRLDDTLAASVRAARQAGCRSCAVVLLHATRQPLHELRLGEWLQSFGFELVVLSHQVSPSPRFVPRGHTALVEACVGPPLQSYLAQVVADLGGSSPLRVMQSNGGLIDPAQLRAKDTILSGPAGGLVGALGAASAAGLAGQALVGFDMGGTSTDVFHLAAGSPGEVFIPERRQRAEVAGFAVLAPMVAIHTVAAGGGSLIHFDGERLRVGPASAGADPGPAAYRRGGPATLTDANVVLGRLQPAFFPRVFGPQGDRPLDGQASRDVLAALARQLEAASGLPHSPEQVAEGAIAIATARMAEAIKRVSVQQGHAIDHAVLCGYGGASGQHVCGLAEALGLSRVLLHPLAGVLSAFGLGLADERLLRERVLDLPLATCDAAAATALSGLRADAHGSFASGGPADAPPKETVTAHLRTLGSDGSLPVSWGPPAAMADAFGALHLQRYGYLPQQPLQLERLSLELVRPAPHLDRALELAAGPDREDATTVELHGANGSQAVPLWHRHRLRGGQVLVGPALIIEATGSIVLAQGWSAQVLAAGELLLQRDGPLPPAAAANPVFAEVQPTDSGATGVDPVQLELFQHRFSAIAERMGERLRQTASSVNIKERLDFSCALFDGRGGLVANAPHIPVHLGSMGDSVVSLLAAVARGERPPLAPGDAVAANNPYNGGTHLPDITVITPVFAPTPNGSAAGTSSAQPLFFVASRGHHGDVGGLTPGSMPPFSQSINEEGLLLDNVTLLSADHFDGPGWRQRLAAGPWPVRDPDRLLADLQAQLAANRLGASELQALVQRQGIRPVQRAMGQVQAHGAAAVRRVIDRLQDGSHRLNLDDGSQLQVVVTVDRVRRRARLDFTGTSAQQASNRNAPLAITKAVVLYVFRTLVGDEIPLNSGCFEPLDLVVPPGCLLHPGPPAAVVAGNVETSQALANLLFAALGVMASAQGTMNNLSFGNDRCQYYETIGGGTGAGFFEPTGFAGADAIQSHMTNSRLTDPEILEARYPVSVERFGIRRGSGGEGFWRGGEGLIRQLRFLEPLTVALISGSRLQPPQGLAGGGPGAPGRNLLIAANGDPELLPGCFERQLAAGDRLRIETPGGGGYGAPSGPPSSMLTEEGSVG